MSQNREIETLNKKSVSEKKYLIFHMQTVRIFSSQNILEFRFEYKNYHLFLKTSIASSKVFLIYMTLLSTGMYISETNFIGFKYAINRFSVMAYSILLIKFLFSFLLTSLELRHDYLLFSSRSFIMWVSHVMARYTTVLILQILCILQGK